MNKLLITLTLLSLVSCFTAQDKNCNYTQEGKFYAGRSKEECAAVKFKCADYWQVFEDDCGCGCDEIGYDKWLDSIIKRPTEIGIDVSNMTPFVLEMDSIKMTFYLRENQKMERINSKIHFNPAGIVEPIPIGLYVIGIDPSKTTLSASGCSVSKKGPLYAAKWDSTNTFRISVSVKREAGYIVSMGTFEFIVVHE